MPNNASDRLDPLLGHLVDGLLDAGERAELEDILRADPRARERYRLFTAAHLHLAARPWETAATAAVASRRPWVAPLAAAAAVVALLAAALAFWQPRQGRGQAPPPVAKPLPPADSSPVLAVTAHADEVRWNLPVEAAGGTTLPAGTVRLDAGVLAINLVNGQTITVRAPACFELHSEREMTLRAGEASLRMATAGDPYVMRVPGGAVVVSQAEFSAQVAADGTTEVHLFDGLANVSRTGPGDRTREELQLQAGESTRIGETLHANPAVADSFLRPLPMEAADSSPAGDAYAAAVSASKPTAWWRFDRVESEVLVVPAAGGLPLVIHGRPTFAGAPGRRFLLTDASSSPGFAACDRGIPGLDTSDGLSVECLIYPTSEQHATVIALDEPALPPPDEGPFSRLRHPPQRLAIERMGLRGSRIGHMHPDFAVRAMMRSPAGYDGGINTYSSESHLLHRWIHLAFTHDGSNLRLYIDGRLSDTAPSAMAFRQAALRPIVARMQPLPGEVLRQWSGGIDEVALYGRVLTPEEIRTHHAALAR